MSTMVRPEVEAGKQLEGELMEPAEQIGPAKGIANGVLLLGAVLWIIIIGVILLV